jgi:hypothetical protein
LINNLASSYFNKGQPPHYFCRGCVSRIEFEMGSRWDHSAIDTRKADGFRALRDCIVD